MTEAKKPAPLKFKHKLGDKLWVMTNNRPVEGTVITRTMVESMKSNWNKVEYELDFAGQYTQFVTFSDRSLFPSRQAVINSLADL